MFSKFKEDQNWSGAVILLYALPFILWISISMSYMSPSKSWVTFGIGICFVLAGAVALILMKRPQGEPKIVIQEIIKEPSEKIVKIEVPSKEIEEAQKKFHEKAQEVLKLQDENVSLKNQNFQVIHAYNSLKKEMEDLNAAPQKKDPELLNIIEDQKEVLKQYEGRILELENTIEDLKYEMNAIMNLNGYPYDANLPEEEILKAK